MKAVKPPLREMPLGKPGRSGRLRRMAASEYLR